MSPAVRDLNLDALELEEGNHQPDSGLCLLEAAGEEHTDHPACASRILGAFGRSLNDALPDAKRQQLKPLIPQIIDTAGDGHDQARGADGRGLADPGLHADVVAVGRSGGVGCVVGAAAASGLLG
jgi:hypothetical protein